MPKREKGERVAAAATGRRAGHAGHRAAPSERAAAGRRRLRQTGQTQNTVTVPSTVYLPFMVTVQDELFVDTR